jgi:hypothetical protein
MSSAKCTKFIPFAGGEPTTFLATGSDLPNSKQIMAGVKKSFVAEGSKPKKKKARKRSSQKIGQGSHATWEVNQNTGHTMDLLEDQDWMLCDKDCGWCGHCADGFSY